MIWRLTYCNKEGVQARLDIIRGASTPVEVIEGTATPFVLNYKLDKSDKSGFFMTSSADISIFETPTFNIDNLKTSSETEIKVEHYINDVLDWSGFVIPDFFSKTIGTPATVEMAASDRLGTLKGVTLDNLPAKISLRNLLTQSLAKTGLTLTLNTQVQLTHGTTNILDTEILSQRLKDNKGRNISCYDIIKSILVATNSTIRQKKGTWQVYNKLEHEAQTASVSFDDVMVGARRTIQPVASSVGVFHEFGGDRLYPDNFNFQSEAINWTAVNGFVMSFDNREVLGYELSGGSYIPVYGAPTDKKYLVNTNDSPSSINTDFNTSPYIKTEIPIVSGYSGSVKITVDINVSGYRGSLQRYQLLAKKGSKILSLNFGGRFEPFNNTDPLNSMWISFPMVDPTEISTISRKVTGTLEDEDLTGYVLELRLYGLKLSFTNFISLSIRNNSETASGNIYKTEQGADFTKIHDIDTSIFGDYILKGLNGYFYDYPLDDTSSLLLSTGELTTPSWTAYGSEDTLPLLQHVSRQKSKLFSIAHDILVADIDLPSFNPLAVYEDCNGKRYTIISAKYDFFRSQVSVELEQALVDNTIQKRDYIYSYFGDGESGISSVGGISGGGTGTGGGGMTAEQIELLNTVAGYWQLDENGNLKTTYNAYSEQELSAYGFGGSGGGGGGGVIETVYGYSNLGGTFSNSTLTDTFNAYTINQLHTRLTAVEGGSAMSITQTGAGNAVTSVTKSGTVITANKGSTFSLSGHTHTIANITGLQTALNAKYNNPTGTTAQYLRGDGSLATFPSIPQGTVTSVGLSAPTGFTVSGSPVTSSGTLNLAFTAGYSLPTTAKQTAWDNHLTATNNPHGVTASQVGALALSGGTMSNTNLVPNLNADLWDGYHWDDLQIGGRNFYSNNTQIGQYRTIVANRNEGETVNGFKITSVDPYTNNRVRITSVINSNGWWTVSFDVRSDDATHVRIDIADIPDALQGTDREISSEWRRVTCTVDVNNYSEVIYNFVDIGLSPFGNYSIEVRNIKVEKGNKATDWTPAPEDVQNEIDLKANIASPIFTGIVTAPTFSGALSGNATSATKLQTARTIWGQSFDGTGNVTGALSQVGNITSITGAFYLVDSLANPYLRLTNSGVNFYVQASSNTRLQIGTTTSNALQIHDNGSIGVGTGTGSLEYKLDVNGTGRFTGSLTAAVSVTTPKVIFAAAGWSMVQVGTELQMQYNGVAKMRFLNGGSIVAVEEITAYS